MAGNKRQRVLNAATLQAGAVAAATSDTNPDPDFPGLEFESVTQKGKFLLFKRRLLHSTQFIHRPTMRELGIDAITRELFVGTGMGAMYEMFEDTYPRLTWEFLSSLRIDRHKSGRVTHLNFRLMNRNHTLTLDAFAAMFGLDPSPSHKRPENFNYGNVWQRISGIPEIPGDKRPANQVHNAPIRIWHKFVGLTIFSRSENHNFRTDDLEILGSYLLRGEGVPKFCIPHHFALHLNKIASSPSSHNPICVGGVITHILRGLQRNANVGFNSLVGQYLSFDYLLHPLGWLRRDHSDGVIYWVIRVDGRDTNSIPVPNPHKFKVVPNADHYLLELQTPSHPNVDEVAPDEDVLIEHVRRRPIRPRLHIVLGQDRGDTPQSQVHYQLPPPIIPQSPYAQPWSQAGSSSSRPQYPPLDPSLVDFMRDMRLHAENEAKERAEFMKDMRMRAEREERERDIMQRKLDRIYYDNAASNFLAYDDYNRRHFRNPGGHQPSYYLAPDGGYYDESGGIRYGDLNIRPDYYSGPIFPQQPPPSTQPDLPSAQWFGAPPQFHGSGMAVGGPSSDVGEPDFASSLAESIFAPPPPTGDPSLGGGKLMGSAFPSHIPSNIFRLQHRFLGRGGP